MSSCGLAGGGTVCPGGVFIVGVRCLRHPWRMPTSRLARARSAWWWISPAAGRRRPERPGRWLGNRTPIGPERRRDAGYGRGRATTACLHPDAMVMGDVPA